MEDRYFITDSGRKYLRDIEEHGGPEEGPEFTLTYEILTAMENAPRRGYTIDELLRVRPKLSEMDVACEVDVLQRWGYLDTKGQEFEAALVRSLKRPDPICSEESQRKVFDNKRCGKSEFDYADFEEAKEFDKEHGWGRLRGMPLKSEN